MGDIDGVGTAWYYWWAGVITITVHDAADAPVSGATVVGSWDGSVTQSCVTSSAGTCTVSRWFSRAVLTTTFSVVDVRSGSQPYQAALDHDPDGSTDGTRITVGRP